MAKVFVRALLLVLGVFLFSAIAVHGQALAKRLILKDGSYQPVVKWEVRGKRVRYLSAERMEWEEVPSSMVDWPATQKYEQDQAVGNLPRVRELDKEEEAERVAEEAATPEVAPGLRLPDQDGIFVLDTFQGQPQLVELLQNGGEINRNMKGNVLRAVINPVASTKQTIELKGPHAQVQAHIARPVIFLRVIPEVGAGSAADKSAPAQKSATSQEANNPQQPQQPTSAMKNLAQLYRLVRCQSKKDNRVVGNINIAIYGKVSQKQSFVPASVEPVSGGWVKLVPSEDLAAGEYAVVEMLGEKEMNLYVWDFGVHPSAPANASAWKPQASAKKTSEQPATLEKR
jgi:hypothetical protein